MAMKRIFLVLALLLGLCVRAAAPLDTEKIWNDANTAYVNADYPAATEGYERLLGEGYESAQLYLNLGNAYFKRGMNGRAILNYRKALRISATTCRSPKPARRIVSSRFPSFSSSGGSCRSDVPSGATRGPC